MKERFITVDKKGEIRSHCRDNEGTLGTNSHTAIIHHHYFIRSFYGVLTRVIIIITLTIRLKLRSIE